MATLSIFVLAFAHPASANETIILDSWWDGNYAENGCKGAAQWYKANAALIAQNGCEQVTSCSEMTPVVQACAPDPRQAVRAFENQFLSQLAASSECSEIEVSIYKGSDKTSTQEYEMSQKPHWGLQINFTPGRQKQWWQMTHSATNAYHEGESDMQSIVHDVCAIVKVNGAKILN